MANRNRIDPLEGSSRSLFFGARADASQVSEPISEDAQKWNESFTRVDSPDGVSCFEQTDETGAILGRVWCRASVEIELVEE